MRINFDQSEDRESSLRDNFGRFQIIIGFETRTRDRIRVLMSKLYQETGIITGGSSSESGVLTIQLTCSMASQNGHTI